MQPLHVVLVVLGALGGPTRAQSEPSCSSPIYCQGDLLHTVQMAAIFADSKTFVDMRLVNTVETTLTNFNKLRNDTNNNPSKEEIANFVNDNFQSSDEFEDWLPADWTPAPQFLDDVGDAEVRQFARNLVNLWPQLARKMKMEVAVSPDKYSLIPVDNGFIIPGGRFKEFYYWDSFWIVRGLLVCEMSETVRGMLENFLLLVDRFGFVPNGARVYYLNRSQPPMLTPMVASYLAATNDTEWLAKNIKLIDKELRFWLDSRTVKVAKNNHQYTLAHYASKSGTPRPESYLEDIRTADIYQDENAKSQLYADLKSGAESGWDFSSRWIVDGSGGNDANVSYVQTRRLVEVDLNAYLCKAFRQISQFYRLLDDDQNAQYWSETAAIWQKTIEQVLYDKVDGIWYDYDTELNTFRKYMYPSNFAPLWAECYDPKDGKSLGKRAANYFEKNKLSEFKGGIPTSLFKTAQQWDFPNAWAPLQHLVIYGLRNSGDETAKKIAKEAAQRWVTANLIGFQNTNEMFEKYDAVNPGQFGGGGEYVVQSGFGWTNGVVLELIKDYYT